MTLLHYPSLELCKKLTEAWFPTTEYQYEKNNNKRSQAFWDIKFWNNWYSYTDNNWLLEAVCPSVMELLDEMPKEIFLNELKYSLTILSDNNWKYAGRDYVTQYWVRYETIHLKILKNIHWWNLPNSLAEMWLWLKENNYLTK